MSHWAVNITANNIIGIFCRKPLEGIVIFNIDMLDSTSGMPPILLRIKIENHHILDAVEKFCLFSVIIMYLGQPVWIFCQSGLSK